MEDLPSYKQFNEGFAYTSDPFKEGDYVWTKTLKINDIAVVRVVASITGIDKNHTAMISVITKSLDTFGEDLASERLILHQKDFNNKEDATKHLIEKEKETVFK
jgi:hypothetical protein